MPVWPQFANDGLTKKAIFRARDFEGLQQRALEFNRNQFALGVHAEPDILAGIKALELVGLAVTVNHRKHQAVVKSGFPEQRGECIARLMVNSCH